MSRIVATLGVAAGVAGALVAWSLGHVSIDGYGSLGSTNIEPARGVDAAEPSTVSDPSSIGAGSIPSGSDEFDLLVTEIRSRITRPLSYDGNRELEMLLMRAFELDPVLAAREVEVQQLPRHLLTSVFREWILIDAPAAKALLGTFSRPALERLLALAIIDVEGETAIEGIVATASSLSVDGLKFAAFVQSASKDPVAAIRRLSDITSRSAAVLAAGEVARLAVDVDPQRAFAEIQAIVDPVIRDAALTELYQRWALTDIPKLLEHLSARNPNLPQWEELLKHTLVLAAESNAEAVLGYAQQTDGNLALQAEASALEVIAMNDPGSATAYLATMNFGRRRHVVAAAVATGYARNDPDAAAAWVRQLNPRVEEAEKALIATVATNDLLRALGLELAEPHTRSGAIVDALSIPDWISDRVGTELKYPAEMANRIVASDQNGRWEQQMLSAVLSRWLEQDIDATLAWMQTNRTDVPVGVLNAVAERIGQADVERRIALADMLPPDRQGEWIEEAVTRIASSDPDRAISIANRYRAADFFESVISSAVTSISLSRGPEIATRFTDASTPVSSLLIIGTQWVRTDPERAASWALGLANSDARANVAATVFRNWADSDVNQATRFARTISDPELRDSALAEICRGNPEAAGCG